MKYIKKFNTAEEVVVYDPFNLVLVADTDTVLYDVPTIGVWIQHIDGKTYSAEQWTSNGFATTDARGVAVVEEEARFVITKYDIISYATWASVTKELIDGVFTSDILNTARTDLGGKQNTEYMLTVDTGGAAYYCNNYGRYLPSLGEWEIACKHYDTINDLMTLIGGSKLGGSYWTSTQSTAGYAYRITWATSLSSYAELKTTELRVRGFTTL